MEKLEKLYGKRSLYSQLPKEKSQKINPFNARIYIAKRTLQYAEQMSETLYNDFLKKQEKIDGTRKRKYD